MGLRSTILDGELVIDADARTGQVRATQPTVLPLVANTCSAPFLFHIAQETLRFLAFDCLVIDGNNIMQRTLDKRYGVRPVLC